MRIDEDSSRMSARISGSSGGIGFSSNAIPDMRIISQPRSDHDE